MIDQQSLEGRAQNSRPNVKVLALQAPNVVLDADHTVLPEITLAQFSLQIVDRATAYKFHMVNSDLAGQSIDHKDVRAVVLTNADLDSLAPAASDPRAVPRGLARHYCEAHSIT